MVAVCVLEEVLRLIQLLPHRLLILSLYVQLDEIVFNQHRRPAALSVYVANNVVRRTDKRMNRNRVLVVEVESDRGFELPLCRVQLRDLNAFLHLPVVLKYSEHPKPVRRFPLGVRSHLDHMRSCPEQCLQPPPEILPLQFVS